MTIDNIEKAEDFVKNLKRSDNWVSNEELLTKLNDSNKIILENGREDLIPFVTVNIALYYIDLGEYGHAWKFTETAKIIAEKYDNKECLLNAISLQYRIQRYLGNIDIAQELVNKQVELALIYNKPFHLCSAYLNQAIQYYLQKLKDECILSFEKALFYAIKNNDIYYIAFIYITYAGNLIEFNELQKAKKVLSEGYNIAKKNNFLNSLSLYYSNSGVLYYKENNYSECIKNYKKAKQLFRKLNNTNEEMQINIMLADAYIKSNQFKEAIKSLSISKDFSEENNIKSNLNDIYLYFSNVYESQHDYKNSLYFFKKHKEVNQDLYNIEADKRIKNLEIIQQINVLKIEKQNAESMASIKHDFLANMSHEIRTPINSIIGICYLLQQQDLNEIQYKYINRLKLSGETLLGIINDVLDISKIESGKMELSNESFSLNSIIINIYNLLEHRANEKNIKFEIKSKSYENIHLLGDAVRLQQVLLNLLSNAIKFTEKGKVILKIEVNNSESNLLVKFIIIDSGIGISKKQKDRIFEQYEQADSSINNKFGGTGLGLSISKKIIELMHGTIDVKSRINKGSKFTIQIPFSIVKQTEKIKNDIEINTAKLNNKIILIADDYEENRLIAKEILLNSNNSIKIIEAQNGKEVLDIIRQNKIDILFIDLDMPIINGIETVQKIRTNRNYNKIKIIGNSASLMTLTTNELAEIGFNDFVQKPYQAISLIYKITSI